MESRKDESVAQEPEVPNLHREVVAPRNGLSLLLLLSPFVNQFVEALKQMPISHNI